MNKNSVPTVPTLSPPEKIKNPISLIATFVTAITGIVATVVYTTKSPYIGVLAVIVIGVIAGLVLWKYEVIASVTALRSNNKKLENKVKQLSDKAAEADKWIHISGLSKVPDPPDKIPEDLSMSVPEQLEFWQRQIRPSLEALGFKVNDHASKTIIGKTYYFSEAIRDGGSRIAFVTLSPEYFLYGDRWGEAGWLFRIHQITESECLVVTSDVCIACDKALHEKEDLELIKGVKVVFINKSLKDWLTRGDAKKYLRSRLR